MKYILLSIGLLLTACTIPQYSVRSNDPTVSQYQTNKDIMECRRLALAEATMNGLQDNMFAEIQVSRIQNECLQGLGYYKQRIN
jgi:hypothetical protein